MTKRPQNNWRHFLCYPYFISVSRGLTEGRLSAAWLSQAYSGSFFFVGAFIQALHEMSCVKPTPWAMF